MPPPPVALRVSFRSAPRAIGCCIRSISASIDLPQGLIAGMTVDASVVVDTRSDVLRLPRELVRVRSDNTAQIKVWNGQQIEQRTITVGLRGDSFVEVLDGLREGEQVVGG